MPGAAVVGYPHALPVTIAFAAPFALILTLAVPVPIPIPVTVPLDLDQFAREPDQHGK